MQPVPVPPSRHRLFSSHRLDNTYEAAFYTDINNQSSMQDCVGKFVEFNIDFAGVESLAVGAAISKDVSFNGDVWRVYLYARGAPGDAGAGEWLSVHLVNTSTARRCRVLFEAIVLGRAQGDVGAAAVAAPPTLHRSFQCLVDYTTKEHVRKPLTKIFRTSDLAAHCVVCGYVTILCGIVLLRHSPIAVPPSSFVSDVRGLEVRNRYGEPDVSFHVDGRSVDVNRSVLAARSPVFKKELELAAQVADAEAQADGPKEETGGMPMIVDEEEEAMSRNLTRRKITVDAPKKDLNLAAESADADAKEVAVAAQPAVIVEAKPADSGEEETVVDGEEEARTEHTTRPKKITMDAPRDLKAWTFLALLLYIYSDRLPKDKECVGAPVTTELLRELLAAADRYRMRRLKLICAKKLWEDVSVETVSTTLYYADKYKCRELTDACMNFIHENSFSVMCTDEFRWLMRESPAILNVMNERFRTRH